MILQTTCFPRTRDSVIVASLSEGLGLNLGAGDVQPELPVLLPFRSLRALLGRLRDIKPQTAGSAQPGAAPGVLT